MALAALSMTSVAAPARNADALCASSSLEQDVGRAHLIAAGTVLRSECLEAGGTIYTRYVLADVEYAKGSGPSDSLQLWALGGEIGGRGLDVEDEVYYQVGRRYVVFAVERTVRGMRTCQSLICATGPFPERRDSISGRFVVERAAGRPIVHVDSTHAVLMRGRPWRWEADDTPWEERPVDSAGRRYSAPPASGPIDELLRKWDARVQRDVDAGRRPPPEGVRWIEIWPHQDPGTRVSEEEFLDWLRMIAHRVAADSTLAK